MEIQTPSECARVWLGAFNLWSDQSYVCALVLLPLLHSSPGLTEGHPLHSPCEPRVECQGNPAGRAQECRNTSQPSTALLHVHPVSMLIPHPHAQQEWSSLTGVCIPSSEAAPAQDPKFRSVEGGNFLAPFIHITIQTLCLLHIIFTIFPNYFWELFLSFSGCLHIVVTKHEPSSNEEASFTKILIYWLLFIFLWNFREKSLLKFPQKNPHEAEDRGGREGTAEVFCYFY